MSRRAFEGGSSNSRLIGRGDLLAALDRAAASKVTIISAPAGSGKTSLLRAWADRPGQPHRLALVQVQRDQRDAQQFWLALLSAIRQAFDTTCYSEPPAATPDFNAPAMDMRAPRRHRPVGVPGAGAQHQGGHTVLTGVLDRSALYGVLAEIEALGLDLIEVRQLQPHRTPEPGNRCSP